MCLSRWTETKTRSKWKQFSTEKGKSEEKTSYPHVFISHYSILIAYDLYELRATRNKKKKKKIKMI